MFKSQNFAQVVDNFAQTCICVSATFRNSACHIPKAQPASGQRKHKKAMTQVQHLIKRILHKTILKYPKQNHRVIIYLDDLKGLTFWIFRKRNFSVPNATGLGWAGITAGSKTFPKSVKYKKIAILLI